MDTENDYSLNCDRSTTDAPLRYKPFCHNNRTVDFVKKYTFTQTCYKKKITPLQWDTTTGNSWLDKSKTSWAVISSIHLNFIYIYTAPNHNNCCYEVLYIVRYRPDNVREKSQQSHNPVLVSTCQHGLVLIKSFSTLPDHSKPFIQHASFTHSHAYTFFSVLMCFLTFTHVHISMDASGSNLGFISCSLIFGLQTGAAREQTTKLSISR